MSAAAQMRVMLDQLMGTAREGPETTSKIKFDYPEVCKGFLLGCCPHAILQGTRMDIGACNKVHDLALRADFENDPGSKSYFFDVTAYDNLEKFILDCDRKTEMAKKRLKATQDDLTEDQNGMANVINDLGDKIGSKLAEAEGLGAEGNVEESLKLMQEVEALKREKFIKENEYRSQTPSSQYQQQKLRVCEICSAYLGIHDNDRRLADHFGGRLHMGFITIRKKFEELKNIVEERRAERDVALNKKKEQESNADNPRSSRHDPRSRERNKSRDRRDRSRSRHNRRSRDHRRRSRSRSSSNSRRYSRHSRRRERKQSASCSRSRSRSPRKDRSSRSTSKDSK